MQDPNSPQAQDRDTGVPPVEDTGGQTAPVDSAPDSSTGAADEPATGPADDAVVEEVDAVVVAVDDTADAPTEPAEESPAEPTFDEPPVEESAVEELAEESPVDEPAVEELAEESAVEEPTFDEPPVEEPAGELTERVDGVTDEMPAPPAETGDAVLAYTTETPPEVVEAVPVTDESPQPQGVWTDEQVEAFRARLREGTATVVDKAAGAVIGVVNTLAAVLRSRMSDRRDDGR